MVAACTSSDVVLRGETRRGYNFTVSSSRASFCVQFFVLFYQLFFSFLFLVVFFYQKQLKCFEFFFILFFLVVSIKLESVFQKNNLFRFNLGLILSEYRGIILYMRLVLWC